MIDVDARIQVFDLKTKYQFQTAPGIDQYNMPLYNLTTEGGQNVGMYPVYQGFMDPVYINGVQVSFSVNRSGFFGMWPNIVQQMYMIGVGDGSTSTFNFTFPVSPNNITPVNIPWQYFLRGHVDITGIIDTGVNMDPPFGTTINTLIPSTSIFPAIYITSVDVNGNSLVVQDSGQFLLGPGNIKMSEYGLLMTPGSAPFGYSASPGGYSTSLNTINYLTGQGQVSFTAPPALGASISAQAYLFQTGLPRGVLFWNNTLVLRSPPDRQYLVELEAYLSPAAFLNLPNAIPFGYMAEYISRGAARKILSDTGDMEQLQFYEPFFREQEMLVWKRSQRQFTATRTQSFYSQTNHGNGISNSLGNQTY